MMKIPLAVVLSGLLAAAGAQAGPIVYRQWLSDGQAVSNQMPVGNYYQSSPPSPNSSGEILNTADFYRFRIDSAVPPGTPAFNPTSITFQKVPVDGVGSVNGGVWMQVFILRGLYVDTLEFDASSFLLETLVMHSESTTLAWIGYALPVGDYTLVINGIGMGLPATLNTGYRASMSGIGQAPTSSVPEPGTLVLALGALVSTVGVQRLLAVRRRHLEAVVTGSWKPLSHASEKRSPRCSG